MPSRRDAPRPKKTSVNSGILGPREAADLERLRKAAEVSADEARVVEAELLKETDNRPQTSDPPDLESPIMPQRVLAEAARWDGYLEEPPRSNHTVFGRWYGSDPAAWCAMYVSYCFYMKGLPLSATTPKGFAWTPAGAQWFADQGRWHNHDEGIEPGFVVFYYWNSEDRIAHTGIVDHVEDDRSFYAWEGNTDRRGGRTGGRVLRQLRKRTTVGRGGGFGIPAFEEPAEIAFPGRTLTLTSPYMQGDDVRIWQQRMRERGWRIEVDGEYGPESARVCRTIQIQRGGLEVDGQVGPETWRAAWRSAVSGGPQ